MSEEAKSGGCPFPDREIVFADPMPAAVANAGAVFGNPVKLDIISRLRGVSSFPAELVPALLDASSHPVDTPEPASELAELELAGVITWKHGTENDTGWAARYELNEARIADLVRGFTSYVLASDIFRAPADEEEIGKPPKSGMFSKPGAQILNLIAHKVDTESIAAGCALPSPAARTHLDALTDEGLIGYLHDEHYYVELLAVLRILTGLLPQHDPKGPGVRDR